MLDHNRRARSSKSSTTATTQSTTTTTMATPNTAATVTIAVPIPNGSNHSNTSTNTNSNSSLFINGNQHRINHNSGAANTSLNNRPTPAPAPGSMRRVQTVPPLLPPLSPLMPTTRGGGGGGVASQQSSKRAPHAIRNPHSAYIVSVSSREKSNSTDSTCTSYSVDSPKSVASKTCRTSWSRTSSNSYDSIPLRGEQYSYPSSPSSPSSRGRALSDRFESIDSNIHSAISMRRQSVDELHMQRFKQACLALHLACWSDADVSHVVELLCAHPECIDAEDDQGRTPIEICKERKCCCLCCRTCCNRNRRAVIAALSKGEDFYRKQQGAMRSNRSQQSAARSSKSASTSDNLKNHHQQVMMVRRSSCGSAASSATDDDDHYYHDVHTNNDPARISLPFEEILSLSKARQQRHTANATTITARQNHQEEENVDERTGLMGWLSASFSDGDSTPRTGHPKSAATKPACSDDSESRALLKKQLLVERDQIYQRYAHDIEEMEKQRSEIRNEVAAIESRLVNKRLEVQQLQENLGEQDAGKKKRRSKKWPFGKDSHLSKKANEYQLGLSRIECGELEKDLEIMQEAEFVAGDKYDQFMRRYFGKIDHQLGKLEKEEQDYGKKFV
mmetsp:Transcript_13827/g.21198  ORF Transcript_13827/g.21198 Transcript_13827/m.21198 type:complete len:618 (-) Transcript_13827:523-2376(-)